VGHPIGRRSVLGAALLAPAACAAPPPAADVPDLAAAAALAGCEAARRGVRLGVHAVATADGRELAHRADERFAHCSIVKVLAAGAVLDRFPIEQLDRRLPVEAADLVAHSPSARAHVGTGMTLREAAEAALRYSDNTAGNLLLRAVGGPEGITAFVRSLGDPVTRSDRWEPALNTAVPGDERDTSTPRALSADVRELVLGSRLDVAARELLRGWMLANTTGDARIRAGAPAGWRVADKTGTGGYGTAGDAAVLWPPQGAPIVLTVLTAGDHPDAQPDEAVFAEVTRIVTTALGPGSGRAG